MTHIVSIREHPTLKIFGLRRSRGDRHWHRHALLHLEDRPLAQRLSQTDGSGPPRAERCTPRRPHAGAR